jgi:uncharacterized repeat protein (TIGR04076 family)
MDEMNNNVLKAIQNHLGYNNQEMRTFSDNPRNLDVLSKVPELLNKTIIIDIIEAHGCNSQHKVGDKFYFDGAGNLLTKYNPRKICIFALGAVDHLFFAAHELWYAGIDPSEMRFKRAACGDVGLKCGGWGRILMEISISDRQKLRIPE